MLPTWLWPHTEPEFEADEIGTVTKALTFYRVMAWIVGVFLVLLVCVGMPLKYWGGQGALSMVLGITHGWLYPVLLIAAYNLGRKANWPLQRLGAIALAGTIPFLSFVAERDATRDVRARIARVQGHPRG